MAGARWKHETAGNSSVNPHILNVDDLTVRFDGLVAIDAVSMCIPDARIHGLIGPNGAGKTTFFNAVNGLVHHSGGTVRLCGRDITRLTADRRAAAGIRRTFQSVQLIQQMTVLENVLIGLHFEAGRNPFLHLVDVFSMSREREAQQSVLEVLEFLGLANVILTPVSELSFAQQRFVELARALVARPVLLMLDEPAAGLSPSGITKLDALLRRLRDEWGMAILLVEHVLSLVLEISDEITVLDNGRLIASGTPSRIASDPRVKAAYLGQDAHAVG
jgi:branched-chain amino acid transport system ATP-binding protein